MTARVVRAHEIEGGVLTYWRVEERGTLARYLICAEYDEGTVTLHDCEGRLKADRLWWSSLRALG